MSTVVTQYRNYGLSETVQLPRKDDDSYSGDSYHCKNWKTPYLSLLLNLFELPLYNLTYSSDSFETFLDSNYEVVKGLYPNSLDIQTL